ncbi:hypothetical protein [Aggregatilinea lenta]|uniref:hypothetical protein n=1 Tax=Aggregatilinea lenta TaxID=913108 RepID=UPI000E5AD940|nr:hypothetical protein [Aggregatilinea lenta]
MPRARIGSRHGSHAITLVYRLPVRLLHPLAVLWALLGGAAVGIGAAMALVLAGIIAPGDDPWLLRGAGIGVGLVAAGLLYVVVYLPGARDISLRVRFETARRAVTLWPLPNREAVAVDALDLFGFRLDVPEAGETRQPCTLLADIDRASPLILLRMDAACDDERADLQRLAGLLKPSWSGSSRA